MIHSYTDTLKKNRVSIKVLENSSSHTHVVIFHSKSFIYELSEILMVMNEIENISMEVEFFFTSLLWCAVQPSPPEGCAGRLLCTIACAVQNCCAISYLSYTYIRSPPTCNTSSDSCLQQRQHHPCSVLVLIELYAYHTNTPGHMAWFHSSAMVQTSTRYRST